MRKIGLLFILFSLFSLGYLFRDEILERAKNFYYSLTLKLPEIKFEIPELNTHIEKRQEILPPPLRVEEKEEIGFLTKEGVIYFTNEQRKKYGLAPLKENQILNHSARLKLEDMFKNQYFAHTSPEGVELKDLIEKVNYQYILIGENLALGNFANDEDLVLAWMESPGHRENILNEKYQEIGVAVGQGIFEGKKVWMAVQHFGKPLPNCPMPSQNLKIQIKENEKKLEELLKEIEVLESQIKSAKQLTKNLKEKIEEYNNLVSEYNLLVSQTRDLISQYNEQVRIYNQCIAQ